MESVDYVEVIGRLVSYIDCVKTSNKTQCTLSLVSQ